MTYLDPVPRDIGHLSEDHGQADGRFVFMASRQAVPLRTEIAEDGPVPEDSTPIEVYRRDTGGRLGLFAADENSLDGLRDLFDTPRRLGMGCREESPGLVGHLVALVPASELGDLGGPAAGPGGPEGAEPDWKASLPEPPELGDGVAAAGPEPSTGDAADGDDDVEHMRFGAVQLGTVVRFASDRKHPADFSREARDLFKTALKGGLPPVSERLMEELPAPSRDE